MHVDFEVTGPWSLCEEPRVTSSFSDFHNLNLEHFNEMLDSASDWVDWFWHAGVGKLKSGIAESDQGVDECGVCLQHQLCMWYVFLCVFLGQRCRCLCICILVQVKE